MHSISRLGLPTPSILGSLRASRNIKNVVHNYQIFIHWHGRRVASCMHVLDRRLTPCSCHTGAFNLREPASRARSETVRSPAAGQGPPTYPVGPCRGMPAMPPPSTIEAARSRPHATLTAPSTGGMVGRMFCGKRTCKSLHRPVRRGMGSPSPTLWPQTAFMGVCRCAGIRILPRWAAGRLSCCPARDVAGRVRASFAWHASSGLAGAECAAPRQLVITRGVHHPAALSLGRRRATMMADGRGGGKARARVEAMPVGQPSRRAPRSPAGGTRQCAARDPEVGS